MVSHHNQLVILPRSENCSAERKLEYVTQLECLNKLEELSSKSYAIVNMLSRICIPLLSTTNLKDSPSNQSQRNFHTFREGKCLQTEMFHLPGNRKPLNSSLGDSCGFEKACLLIENKSLCLTLLLSFSFLTLVLRITPIIMR